MSQISDTNVQILLEALPYIRRFHGKVTAVCVGLGISEERIAIYCRSGRSKLVDTLFSEPRLSAVEFALEGTDQVSIRIDFDRGVVPKVSGQMEIRVQVTLTSVLK